MKSERAYGIPPPAYRLPDATRIGAVRLQVSDLSRSLDYYEHILGLRALERTTGAAVLGVSGSTEPLVRLHERRGARRVPPGGAFGLFHFAILLPSRSALGRFAAHITHIGHPIGMANHLVSESIYLSDPDGLGIEVYADRPPSTWQHLERELRIGTEPLDVGNLIAEAGRQPWDAAPERTTMGHIHLHVADLAAAERFYHAALGFDKTVWHYPGALFMAAGGYHHHLATNTWSRGPAAAEDQARLLSWELLVPGPDDAAAVSESLQSAGFAAKNTGAGWTTADPWGTALTIVGGLQTSLR